METKEMKIVPPNGYEIDKENSTFECIKFKPKLTYKDVLKTLENDSYYDIRFKAYNSKQVAKLIVINKLMNLAKYLNGDWKPNWEDDNEEKWCIIFEDNDIDIVSVSTCCSIDVYFKSKTLAQQAIDILGKEVICLALSTDW